MIVNCEHCGKPFEAVRSTARFCSAKCRQYSFRNMKPVVPDDPPAIAESEMKAVDEIAWLALDAKGISAAFERMSVGGPIQLRAPCSRISRSIRKSLEDEGLW